MSIGDEFVRRIESDRLMAAMRRAVADGDDAELRRLGFGGFAEYAQRLSELMGDSVREGHDPQAEDFAAIMEEVARPVHYAHHLVNEAGTAIQSAKDKPLGIRIKPAEPDFDDDALKGTVGTAANAESPEQTVGILADGLAYAVKKTGNDFIKANAEAHSRAGFEVKVKRSGSTKCCPWCAARIGSWAIANAPDGVFGCHANCSCVVEYTSGTGAVSQRRGTGRFVEVDYQPPHVMSREEAREKGGFDKPKRLNLFNLNSELDYMSNSIRLKYSADESQLKFGNIEIPVRRVINSNFDMYVASDEKEKSRGARLCEKYMRAIQSRLPSDFSMPKIVVLDFEKYGLHHDAIGGYNKELDSVFINSRYDTPVKILEYVNRNPGRFANKTVYAPYLHELGHKYYEDCIKRLANSENIEYNKAKSIIDRQIYEYVEKNNTNGLLLENSISEYAQKGFLSGRYTEIAAESFTVADSNETADEILEILKG